MGENAWLRITPKADLATLLPEKRCQCKREQILSMVCACAESMLAIDAALLSGAGGDAGADGIPRRAADPEREPR
jgi:hypothetical protein